MKLNKYLLVSVLASGPALHGMDQQTNLGVKALLLGAGYVTVKEIYKSPVGKYSKYVYNRTVAPAAGTTAAGLAYLSGLNYFISKTPLKNVNFHMPKFDECTDCEKTVNGVVDALPSAFANYFTSDKSPLQPAYNDCPKSRKVFAASIYLLVNGKNVKEAIDLDTVETMVDDMLTKDCNDVNTDLIDLIQKSAASSGNNQRKVNGQFVAQKYGWLSTSTTVNTQAVPVVALNVSQGTVDINAPGATNQTVVQTIDKESIEDSSLSVNAPEFPGALVLDPNKM